MNDAALFFREISKRHGVDLPKEEGTPASQLRPATVLNTTVQGADVQVNISGNLTLSRYIQTNKGHMDMLPASARQLANTKAKTKPFHRSVIKFREIMVKTCSPLEKLFMLRDLKDLIQLEVQDFWQGVITDPSKLILNRDELTSIMIFVIVKAEIPDLYSQLKLISEFTSADIQEATKGFPLSEIFMLI